MATDTERFNSRFKKAERGTGGTRDRRRIFEDGGADRETTSSRSVASGYTGTSSSGNRYRASDRTDSPSSTARSSSSTATSSISTRINKLHIDDKDEKDNAEDAEQENKEEADEEEAQPKRVTKKAGGPSANSAKKRQAKKNLRQKRRSTGVVIMPGQPSGVADEEEKLTLENTAKNMDAEASEAGVAASASGSDNTMYAKQMEQYEKAIEDLKDELAKAHKELDTLRTANLRLKDENSALLRVVNNLAKGGK